ncbi:neuropilin-1-like [Porites lutea]|uniref:neuropilin-1-like n=1 Tax=Porites lutea TaxID=51062 RepID=UPI003CC62C5E
MQVLKTQAFTVFIILLLGNLVILECEACNETHVGADSGILQSPNFPHNYPNEAYCSWNIRVNQSQHVFLMFSSSFSLQAENNTDVIRVYDGGNTTGEVLGVFYGGHPPPQGGLYSSANQMFVVFKTDNNKSFSGFQASYHALTCSDPLGMESGAISDAQISASSHYTKNWRRDHSAKKARLNSKVSWRNIEWWAAATSNLHQWLQVDFGGYTKVTRVATLGSGDGIVQYVTKFKIRYSSDGVIWQFYKEPGNANASAKVRWTC